MIEPETDPELKVGELLSMIDADETAKLQVIGWTDVVTRVLLPH